MNGRRLQWALWTGVLLCPLLVWRFCARERPAPVAHLSSVLGSGVSRDFADKPHAWQPATRGDALALGDGARTDGKSGAELTFIDGTRLALQANTTVRLLPGQGGGAVNAVTSLDVQSGEAVLRVGERALSLRTHVGTARIAPNSQVSLTRNGDALRFNVALGAVNFRERDENSVGIGDGDTVNVGIGMAVLELKRAAEPERAEPAPAGIRVEVGRGEIRLGGADGSFRALASGSHQVPPGAVLELGPGASLVAERGRDRLRLRGAGTFVIGVGDALAETQHGSMSIEALDADVEVRVPGGVIIARRSAEGTRAELAVDGEQGQLKVERGNVAAKLQGREEELFAGDERRWNLATSEQEGGAQAGPGHRNMLARAGESFVVHTPELPVAVGFDFGGRCSGEGVLELAGTRQRSRAQGSANLALGAGLRAYTLRCIGPKGTPGRIVARGTVQVLVDAGTRKLPPRAPTTEVVADGRTYRIYYQNQLPEVRVQWPNPPTADAYQLELDGKPIDAAGPEHLFRSGDLRDGTHTLAFQAQGRRSRTTTVEVLFDNVAPKASLSAPEDRSFQPGDLVTVEGVALPTWKVALEGGTIETARGERFFGQVQTSKEHPDIAVRLSHRRLGTHYYLRRASGSP